MRVAKFSLAEQCLVATGLLLGKKRGRFGYSMNKKSSDVFIRNVSNRALSYRIVLFEISEN